MLIKNGEKKVIPLKQGNVTLVEAGIPHILVVHEDLTTFEWWDGDFTAELAGDLFNDYTKNRIGPEDYERG